MNRIKIPFTLLVVSLLLVQSVAWIASPRTVQAAPPLQTCSPEQTRATERWWFFGNSATIDFDTSGTTATAQSPATFGFGEGSTVVSDTTGQLLFYSDGQEVYDANHQVMPNGNGLLGDSSATQTVAAFPAVGQPGVYFVVANSTDAHNGPPNNQLYYSVVDMSLNGGLGDVTATKNVPLGNPSSASEALTAVPNDDGTGFWVVTYTNNSQNFLAYEFDANGPVTGGAVTSTLPSSNYDGWGTLNPSPDLSQIVLLSGDHDGTTTGNTFSTKVALLDFDATTGQATQQFEWELPTGAGTGNRGYSADFSPDGSYIYATKIFGTGQLYRYDIANNNTGPTVQASEEQLGSIGVSGGQVKRGPDGRMYVANNGGGVISVVNDPDNPVNPDYAVGGFALAGGSTSSFGLPQMATGCPLPAPGYEVAKTANPASGTTVEAGQTINYTLTVTNTGDTVLNDLSVTDALSDVVDDATYNNNANADVGTAIFNAPDNLTWEGDLGVGQVATVTYSATVNNPPTGNGTLVNTAATSGTPISNCSPEAGTPESCTTTHNVAPLPDECSEAFVNCLTNPITSKKTILEVDDACTIQTAGITGEGEASADDPQYTYPMGLMDFELDCGTPGYTTTVTQYYFEPDASSSDYILRKHLPDTGEYFTVENYTLSETTLDGENVLVATYDVTDGGELDIDGEVNGLITDPVGPALNPDSELANTGQSPLSWITGALAAIGVAIGLYLRLRRNDKQRVYS